MLIFSIPVESTKENRMSGNLPRLKPRPIPKINPVPEALVRGERRVFYDETKALFQLPWMGVVTMCFSHYPNFYKVLLAGMRDIAQTEEFVGAEKALCSIADEAAARLGPNSLISDLKDMGYSEVELDNIRAVAEIFRAGNMPYILIATIARLLLEGGTITDNAQKSRGPRSYNQTEMSPLVLIELHHADQSLAETFDRIKSTLGLPLVNTDYRALARWPSYFQKAWATLEPHIASEQYEPLVVTVHEAAERFIRSLPGSTNLNASALCFAAEKDASLDEVLSVVRLFQWLLPGLAVNVAFLRKQL